MGSKIVSIFVTVFMFIMCMLALLTLNMTNLSKSNDLQLARASSSVVSTDGEITKGSEVILRGSSLISSIIGADVIDNRLDDGDKIYTAGSYHEGNGVIVPIKVYSFQGLISSPSEVISKIDPDGYYTISYGDSIDSKSSIVVTINQFTPNSLEE